jgi:hypothetical protein
VTRGLALAVTVGAIFAAVASRFPVNDSDVFWQLQVGRWTLEHRALYTHDTLSATLAGAGVPVNQWLGQVLLWVAFAAGSWWGILALRVVSVFVIATVTMWAAIARASRPAIAATAAFPGLALSRFVWADRPELLNLVLFAIFAPLALAARGGDRRAQVALVPLMALWTNIHGGFVVAVVLLVALGFEAALFAEPPRRRAFLGFAALAILATFLNPLGPAVYASPQWHFANAPRFIQEWGVPDVTTFPGLLFATTLLGVLALAPLTAPARSADVAMLAPLTFLSLSALRHMPLFALAAAPFLAERISLLLPRLGSRVAAREPWALALPLAGVVLVASLATAPRDPDLSGYPTGALAALHAKSGALFNDYDWGGFLTWYAPEHPVFIDGRLEPYVPRVLDDYRDAIGAHPGWSAVLDRWHIDLVLVRPASALAVRLQESGWTSLYRDDDTVLLSRR